MISKKYKTLEIIGNVKYVFHQMKFKQLFDNYIQSKKEAGEKITKDALYCVISDATYMTPESVKQWYFANCGPGDISIVKNIAEIFNVDYRLLLISEDEKEGIEVNVDNKESFCDETNVIKKVYDMVLDWNDIRIAILNGEPIPNTELENPNKRYLYQKEYIASIHKYIDRQALNISEKVWEELHHVLTDIEYDSDYHYSDHWDELNPRFHDIRYIYAYDDPMGILDLEQDAIDEKVNELEKELIANIKDGIAEENEPCDVLGLSFKLEYLYRYEYTRTIGRLFREKFPQLTR